MSKHFLNIDLTINILCLFLESINQRHYVISQVQIITSSDSIIMIVHFFHFKVSFQVFI